MRRGELWYADLPILKDSSLQCGRKLVVIISNDKNNEHSSIIHVVPLTSQPKKWLPTHVYIVKNVPIPSYALLEQTRPIPKDMFISKVGKLGFTAMQKIEKSLLIQFGINF